MGNDVNKLAYAIAEKIKEIEDKNQIGLSKGTVLSIDYKITLTNPDNKPKKLVWKKEQFDNPL